MSWKMKSTILLDRIKDFSYQIHGFPNQIQDFWNEVFANQNRDIPGKINIFPNYRINFFNNLQKKNCMKGDYRGGTQISTPWYVRLNPLKQNTYSKYLLILFKIYTFFLLMF